MHHPGKTIWCCRVAKAAVSQREKYFFYFGLTHVRRNLQYKLVTYYGYSVPSRFQCHEEISRGWQINQSGRNGHRCTATVAVYERGLALGLHAFL